MVLIAKRAKKIKEVEVGTIRRLIHVSKVDKRKEEGWIVVEESLEKQLSKGDLVLMERKI